jgi:hypothetical protein
MPNYCNNTLNVTGPKEAIDRFLDSCRNVTDPHHGVMEFSFGGIVPRPAQFPDSGDPVLGDWYHWNVDNWGTKCDIEDEPDMDRMNDENLTMTFDTAWPPPVLWVKAATEKFPELRFQLDYIEVGNNFNGTSIGENGVLVDECHELTPEELAEYFGDDYEADEDDLNEDDLNEDDEDLGDDEDNDFDDEDNWEDDEDDTEEDED